MIVIEPKVEVLKFPTAALLDIEKAARTCYKSEDKIKPGSGERLVAKLCENGHHAMLEFADISVKFTTDRAVYMKWCAIEWHPLPRSLNAMSITGVTV